MKIGMMVDSYKPYISGVTNQVELLKKHLELEGHDVYVFTFGDLDYTDKEKNIIRSPGLPLADTGFYLSLRYSRSARKILQTMDIVHVHHPFLSGRLALRYCRPPQIPIILTYHSRYDLMAQAYLPFLPEEISHGVLQTYLPSFCEATELVTTPSDGMVQILRDLNVEAPIEVVPNGIDIEVFQTAKPLMRTEFNFKDSDILLVYVGRIAAEKNIPFLLQSFSGVAQAIGNTHLLIIGSGIQQYQDEINQQVLDLNLQDRVHFLGKVEYKNLPAYMAMCDIFVTASVAETFGMSIVEAMGAGLPVMGIHSVGVGDVVEDGVTGLLANHELSAFTAKLTLLCLDKNLRKQMSITAKKMSYKYAIGQVTKTLISKYKKIMHGFQPRKNSWRARLYRLAERLDP